MRFVPFNDERGNLSSLKNANGTYTGFEYDGANQLISAKNYDAKGNVINSFTYSYDANGNRSSVITQSGTINYKYDELNQLTEETLLDGTVIDYAYDSVGNLLSKTTTNGSTTSQVVYTYDAANQLTNVGGTTYSYDAAGNLIDNGTYLFTYNADNRLIQVNNKSTNALLASYTYDDQGRRATKTTPNGTSYYHYDQYDNVIYVSDRTSAITTDFTWDDHGRPVTMTQNGITYYYHLNGHGDVTALTDNNGNVVASYQYDAWGNVITKSGSMADANPYRYASYRYDEIMGMYYTVNRMYDPMTGRFIQRDFPKGMENITSPSKNQIIMKDEHKPIEQNRYVYVQNNPIMKYDPEGHRGKTRFVVNGSHAILYLSSTRIKQFLNRANDFSTIAGAISGITGLMRSAGVYTAYLAALSGALVLDYYLIKIISKNGKYGMKFIIYGGFRHIFIIPLRQ